MTPREIENKRAFDLISSECLKIEECVEKFRVHLYAVGLASIAENLGNVSAQIRGVRNYAIHERSSWPISKAAAYIDTA